MDAYERKEDIRRTHEILRKQRELVSSSKEEAEKLLTSLGIMHLFVPIKKTRKSKPKKAIKIRKAGKSKSTGK